MAFFPMSRNRGLLAVNHEALDSAVSLFSSAPDYSDPETVSEGPERPRRQHLRARTATGVVAPRALRYARRITANTEMELTGPAAGHPLLQTSADPTGTRVLGTFNNCSTARRRGSTYLTCEENFNGYFGTESAFTPTPLMVRYGVSRGDHPWWLGRPPLRPCGQSERAEPLRLGRRDRPERPGLNTHETDRARPPQARGRLLHRSRRRPGGHLHQ